jgi:hypothetical protein
MTMDDTLVVVANLPSREQIGRLEAAMREMPQVEIEPVHHFTDGVYAREITIRAGTCLTGKTHKTEHINIISSGKIAVWTEDGMRVIEAPCTILSKPGAKRVGFAIEDTVWTTIHNNPDNSTDLVALESRLIAPDNLLENEDTPWLG